MMASPNLVVEASKPLLDSQLQRSVVVEDDELNEMIKRVIVAVGIDGVDCDPVKVGERTALCFEQPGAPLHEGGRNGAYFQVMS